MKFEYLLKLKVISLWTTFVVVFWTLLFLADPNFERFLEAISQSERFEKKRF